MRVEVPEKVAPLLNSYRFRYGSMELANLTRLLTFVHDQVPAAEVSDIEEWIMNHPNEIGDGIVRGFIVEGTDLGPEPVRGEDDTDV